jgi:hypothetical protein
MVRVITRAQAIALGVALALALGSGCGPDDLFVSAALAPDADCAYTASGERVLDVAEFDIGANPDTGACARAFSAHLGVKHDNSLQVRVRDAEVRLMTSQRRTIFFDRENTQLPNPFRAAASGVIAAEGSGVVTVELVPRDYAAQLDQFVGKRVLAELELRGETEDGDEIPSNRFELTIELCDGCRTFCAGDPAIDDAPICEEDGECIDPDC